MDITAHFVRKITAEPCHSGASNWIDLKIHEHSPFGKETVSTVILFINGPDASEKVDAYAAAINGVNPPMANPAGIEESDFTPGFIVGASA